MTSFEKSEHCSDSLCDSNEVPSFRSVLQWLDVKHRVQCDAEQRMTYEIICSSLLLKIIDDNERVDDDECSNANVDHVTTILDRDLNVLHKDVESVFVHMEDTPT